MLCKYLLWFITDCFGGLTRQRQRDGCNWREIDKNESSFGQMANDWATMKVEDTRYGSRHQKEPIIIVESRSSVAFSWYSFLSHSFDRSSGLRHRTEWAHLFSIDFVYGYFRSDDDKWHHSQDSSTTATVSRVASTWLPTFAFVFV